LPSCVPRSETFRAKWTKLTSWCTETAPRKQTTYASSFVGGKKQNLRVGKTSNGNSFAKSHRQSKLQKQASPNTQHINDQSAHTLKLWNFRQAHPTADTTSVLAQLAAYLQMSFHVQILHIKLRVLIQTHHQLPEIHT
jgi:hypothetical protein